MPPAIHALAQGLHQLAGTCFSTGLPSLGSVFQVSRWRPEAIQFVQLFFASSRPRGPGVRSSIYLFYTQPIMHQSMPVKKMKSPKGL